MLFKSVKGLDWQAQMAMELTYSDEVKRIHSGFSEDNFRGWLQAICKTTFLRRAVDDAILAMRMPTEAFVYLYRGFEWLEDGLHIEKGDGERDSSRFQEFKGSW